MAKPKPTYIILAQTGPESLSFWNGRRWVSDYGEAQVFFTEGDAHAARERNNMFPSTTVVKNYGLEDEQIIALPHVEGVEE